MGMSCVCGLFGLFGWKGCGKCEHVKLFGKDVLSIKNSLYDIPVPGPHIGSGITPKKSKNSLSQGNKGKKPSGEQQRRIPLPRWTEAIDVM